MKINIIDFNYIFKRYSNYRTGLLYLSTLLKKYDFNINLHNIDFVLELDANFIWGRNEPDKIFKKEWIGLLHIPSFTIPSFLNEYLFLKNIDKQIELFQKNAELCKGIICLSKYHADNLKLVFEENNIDIKVEYLFHPAEEIDDNNLWNFSKFWHNKNKKIIQIGWFLRKLFSMNLLPKSNVFNKVQILKPNKNNIEDLIINSQKNEIESNNIPIFENVTKIEMVSNENYDKLLSENIIFTEYYDVSASNLIIECIMRGTPMLINNHPAIEEYLGEDYCLYYNNYEEAIKKSENFILLKNASLQLLNRKHLVNNNIFLKNFNKIVKNFIKKPTVVNNE